MKNKFFLLKLLGILILLFLLKQIDFSLTLSRIRNCNLSFLVAAFFVELSVLGIRVVRWKYILEMLKIKVNFLDALKAFWSGLYLAAITPGKVGEISRAYFLDKSNPSIGRSVFSVVLDRLTDLVSLLLLGVIASFIYLKQLKQLNTLLLFSLIGLVLVLWLIFFKREFFYKLFRKIVYKFISKEKLPLKEDLDLGIFKTIELRNYAFLSSYVVLGWSLFFFGWWLLTKALHIDISFFKVMATVSIATVISVIPVSISGLGTRDATVMFIFSKMGIAKDSAISFSLLIFSVEILIVGLGIIFFLKNSGKKETGND